MLGYVHDTTKIWRLWDSIESRVIQASNVKFDEALMTGERIIDELVKDTLHELANSGNNSDERSDDEARTDAFSSGMLIEITKDKLKDQDLAQ